MAMGVQVLVAGPDRVELTAPLAPNINHRDTLFGGSAAAIATLAAWTLVELRLVGAGMAARLVISRSDMTYDTPVTGDFSAVAKPPPPSAWDRFLATVERRGRGRVTVQARVVNRIAPPPGSRRLRRHQSDFVAIRV